MVDVQRFAEFVELMLASRDAVAQAEEPVCELLAVVHCPAVVCLQTMRGGQNRANAQWASAFQIAQEAPCVGCSFCIEDADECLPRRPVDGHEQIAAAAFIGHLGEVFHFDVEVSGLIGFEGAVFRPGFLGLHVAQVPDIVTKQATIQPPSATHTGSGAHGR